MSGPDPTYDLIAAIDEGAPGIVLQRSALDTVADAYASGDYARLTASQIVTLIGPLPSVPTALPWMDPI